VNIWVQCLEIEPLRRVRRATGLSCFLLLESDADWERAIATHAHEINGFGVHKDLLFDRLGRSRGLVERAHAQGQQVHAWTYRDDVLPSGVSNLQQELMPAFRLGVDAVFCDFPDSAIDCRRLFSLS
jgi:glycerophosphoryl diester phosphodiesterase